MNSKPSFIAFLFSLIILVSCKKESKSTPDCFPDDPIVRQIADQPATVKLLNNTYYIIGQGTIDTQLKPCNLSKEFQVDNLPVIVSGDVKSTVSAGPGPAGIDNFVITTISK